MQKKNLALVSLGHLSCDINAGALPAALPFVRSAYNLDYQATGGLMLAFSCLSSILQPLLGLLADKHSKPWFIPLGVLLAGLGLTLIGFLGNYWAIFCAVILSGIGSAFFHPEGARFANKISGKRKGAAMSIFSIGGNTGYILGPLFVTIFVGTLGLSGMAVFGILAFVMATILWLQISHLPSKPTIVQAAPQNTANILPSDVEAEELSGPLKPEVKPEPRNDWREFRKLMLVIICRSINFVGCNTFIPLYMVNALGQHTSLGGIALIIFGASGVGFNILGGIIGDKLGYVPTIRIAFSLMPVFVFLFGLNNNIVLAYLLLPLLALPLYFPFSSQVVLGQKLLAKNIGFASGVTLGLATTLGGIAQPLLGWLADNYGLHSIFFCLASIGLLGALFSWLLTNRKEPA